MAKKNVRTEKDKRTNDILLGPLERPALAFFAKHMPMWINSDMLTLFALFGAALIGVAYFLAGRAGDLRGNGYLFLVNLGLFIHWFGDSLDGTLARYRHHERPNYGYYTDHALDGLSSLMIFLGIGLSGIADFKVTMITLAAWLLAMMQVYLKTHATGVFEMTSIKIGPTEIRVLLAILNTIIYFTGAGKPLAVLELQGMTINFTLGTIVLAVLAIALLIYYIYQVITTGSKLSAEDLEALKVKNAERARQGILSQMEIDRREKEEKLARQQKPKSLLDFFIKPD
ncbi:MAG TPA: CDP-alcohol phosphatidyltransferase family protein [Anaerolineaceae bacterium]|jgi:hypothetical protein|nr:CDP-alcohol phosphatidyltransferase family protein [Anaerolineaceae bacterium]